MSGPARRRHDAAVRILKVAWASRDAAPRSRVRTCASYIGALLLPVGLTAAVTQLAEYWPKPVSWQYLGISLVAALVGGVGPGFVALVLGTIAVVWLGVPTPVHPGVEMFATVGIVLLVVIGRFQSTQRQLRERAAVLRSVIDSMPDAIYVATRDRITLSNAKAQRFCGAASLDELSVGALAERLALRSPSTGEPFSDDQLQFSRALSGETIVEEVLTRDAETGTDALLRSACAPIVDGGAIIGAVAVHSDITHVKKTEDERNRAEQALHAAKDAAERARTAAEEANAAKDHFLALLSHELRTPLSAVAAGLELLKRERDLSARGRTCVDAMDRNIHAESRLIDNLLDVTRLIQGDLRLNRRDIDVGAILHHTIDACRAEAVSRQLDFFAGCEAEGPWIVDGDDERLGQVFWNLLKNAIKFTPAHGAVTVQCSVEENWVTVEVIDTGVGIAPADLGSIFDAFSQAERTLNRRFGGAGLGLTLSRWIVEQHGGTIAAESNGPGTGATFTVRLPLVASAAQRTGTPRVANIVA